MNGLALIALFMRSSGRARTEVLDTTQKAAHHRHGLQRTAGRARIVRIDPETGKQEEVFRFPAGQSRFSFAHSLCVSRDERTIYHSGVVRSGQNVVLVDNFR